MTATVIVSFIIGVLGAIFTGFSLIATKENKVSDNRQDWINDQREDIAAALAAAYASQRSSDPADRLERFHAFDEAQGRIELRENPDRPEWSQVRTSLDNIRGLLVGGSATADAITAERTLILDHARPELKKNWEIVKSGETFFVVFKRVFVGWLLVLGMSLIAINAISLFSPSSPAQKRSADAISGQVSSRPKASSASKGSLPRPSDTSPAAIAPPTPVATPDAAPNKLKDRPDRP